MGTGSASPRLAEPASLGVSGQVAALGVGRTLTQATTTELMEERGDEEAAERERALRERVPAE
jgi:hypothetical protein